MDAMTPSDLDQLSEVITQALQVVDDVEGVKGDMVIVDDEAEMKREPGVWGQLGKMSGEEFTPKGRRSNMYKFMYIYFNLTILGF